MIGHYLLMLSPDQEDRLLTQTITPGEHRGNPEQRCLTMVVMDCQRDPVGAWRPTKPTGLRTFWVSPVHSIPERYDSLCDRFGAPRVNAAIRNRILSNRARRLLAVQDTSVASQTVTV